MSTEAVLPELASVPWRERTSDATLARRGHWWTAYTIGHVVPFIAAAAALLALNPISLPVAAACFAHAWIIPELYAFRGANVIRPRRRRGAHGPERVAQGLLGDLLGHDERNLQRETGLALERGALGTWVVGEAGALLVRRGGRRVHCYCVGVPDPELPPSDRIAHLLLALRTDESGFATVANHAFSGAPWRLRRRLAADARPALGAAPQAASIAGVAATELTLRDGSVSDLETTFALSEHAMHDSGTRQGIIPPGRTLTDAHIQADWSRQRPVVEFIAAQPEGRYVIAEDETGPIGYARVVRFPHMEELTELMVLPEHQGRGIGRRLLQAAWPGDPSADLGREVVAAGTPSDLSLYIEFGVMPVAGHWHMRQRADAYLERRAQETETTDPAVHLLKPDRAVAEWNRLEPQAIGHERPALHEFFARDRNCLAALNPQTGEAEALCWVSGGGAVGPARG